MSENTSIYIGLGSNIGQREVYLSSALLEMQHINILPVRRSAIYESAAWGFHDQASFLNQVVEVTSSKSPNQLLKALKSIEEKLGREPRKRWREREIDLDILYFGDRIVDQPDLQIPHRYVRQRKFVLVPLQEIAPDFVDPQTGQTISQILKTNADESDVSIYHTLK